MLIWRGHRHHHRATATVTANGATGLFDKDSNGVFTSDCIKLSEKKLSPAQNDLVPELVLSGNQIEKEETRELFVVADENGNGKDVVRYTDTRLPA